MAGEYTGQVMLDGITAFLKEAAPGCCPRTGARAQRRQAADPRPDQDVPIRPPGFCTGCPERPIFAAMKLVQKETGKHQISADIGCHLFASLPPFRDRRGDDGLWPWPGGQRGL
jgi:indolepyruvate ferredoxin oxidoreductase, alpha subunit